MRSRAREGAAGIIWVIVLLAAAAPLKAQGSGDETASLHRRPLSKIGHYMGTHKVLLVSDAILILGGAADDASTVHCRHMHPACVESNPILPGHATNAQIYGQTAATAVAFIAFNHWIARKYRHDGLWGYSYLLVTTPLVIESAVDTAHNIRVADTLAAARGRVSRPQPDRVIPPIPRRIRISTNAATNREAP